MVNVAFKGRAVRGTRGVVDSLVQFISNKLLPGLPVSLTIHFKSLPGYCDARCINVEQGARDPRHFILEIDNRMSIMRVLLATAHEMVHVKQYAMNELSHCTGGDDFAWHGIVHTGSVIPHDTAQVSEDYWDLPFEIEAHGRQTGLVICWMNSLGLTEAEPWYERPF